MAELHTIKAQLYDNALTENPNDFIARVSSESSLGVADICKQLLKEPRTALLDKVLSVG